MSVRLMNMVFERFPVGGGKLVLALALADHADDMGGSIFPSVDHMAKKTRQSRRTVQYQLREMESMGWLQMVLYEGGGRSKAREYRINPLWVDGLDLSEIKASDDNQQQPTIDPDNPKNEKGANIAPVQNEAEGAQSTTQRAQSEAQKGAIAVAPKPSGTIKESSYIWRGHNFSEWPEMPDEKRLMRWNQIREKNKNPINEDVIEDMASRLKRIHAGGFTVQQAFKAMCTYGWQSVHIDWLRNKGIKPERNQSSRLGNATGQSEVHELWLKFQNLHAEKVALERIKQPVPDKLISDIEQARNNWQKAKQLAGATE